MTPTQIAVVRRDLREYADELEAAVKVLAEQFVAATATGEFINYRRMHVWSRLHALEAVQPNWFFRKFVRVVFKHRVKELHDGRVQPEPVRRRVHRSGG